MKRHIEEFEIISHGVEGSQYFQGCGVSFTPYEDVATGCGMTEKEAFDDALDSLAQNDWFTSAIESSDEYQNASDEIPEVLQDQAEDSECYFYLSIRVK